MFIQNSSMMPLFVYGVKMCCVHFTVILEQSKKEKLAEARKERYAKWDAAIKSRKVHYVSDLIH